MSDTYGGRARLAVYLKPEQAREIERRAAERDISASAIARELIASALGDDASAAVAQ
jgi:hypothetical protein